MAYMRHIVNLPNMPTGKRKPYFREPSRCLICLETTRERFCLDCKPLVDMAKWSESSLAMLRCRFKTEVKL